MLADSLQRYVLADFDDQLVMNVPDDEAMAEGLHGIGQDVPADSLHDILDKFWTVRFDSGPLLLSVHAHIGDGLAAEHVIIDSGFCICQLSARGEADE